MNDLDWLARNVRMWPPTADYLVRVGSEGYTFREHCEGETIGAMWFTRDQWLARRADLQNKPSWKDAPEWAEWLAQDADGEWFWYEDEPNAEDDWFRPVKNMTGNVISIGCGSVIGDWRDTLERRPQAAKPEPSGDDWHKRGELPPVGKRVRLLFKGDYAYDCEIVAVRGGYVVLWCADAYMSEAIKLEDCRFEPIQTERERVASELVDVMMAVPASDSETTSEHHMRVALAIYDHLHK